VSYLLDTCTITELWKPNPSEAVIAWLDEQDEETLFLSALTLGEIQKGIERVTGTRKSSSLRKSLRELQERFGARVLPVSREVAIRWGELSARRDIIGRPLSVVDGLIAATSLCQSLALVTRNVRDFEHMDLGLVSPW
jgi:toxin FitB